MNENSFSKIAVVGLGYVGLPLAVEFAKRGINVIGIERNIERVKAVNKGMSYIEDVKSKDLEALTKKGNLK